MPIVGARVAIPRANGIIADTRDVQPPAEPPRSFQIERIGAFEFLASPPPALSYLGSAVARSPHVEVQPGPADPRPPAHRKFRRRHGTHLRAFLPSICRVRSAPPARSSRFALHRSSPGMDRRKASRISSPH